MITIDDIANKSGLTRTAVAYRIKQMGGLPIRSIPGKVGAIRVYTEEDLQAIIDYQAKKPGRKRKDG